VRRSTGEPRSGEKVMDKNENEIKQAMLEMLFEKTGKGFSPKVMKFGIRPGRYGVVRRPDGHARVMSDCGDTIEIFLRMKNGRVEDARFTSEGCVTTVASAQAASEMAVGKSIRECLAINQTSIINYLDGLPDESRHCAWLAALALHRALRYYAINRKGHWRTEDPKNVPREET
jgi:nitrogen fixation NifU-like protein